MGRSGRTLLIVAVMGLVSIATLMWLADRYNEVLQKSAAEPAARPAPAESTAAATLTLPSPESSTLDAPTPDEKAQVLVGAFLGVRNSMRAALDATAAAGPAERLAILARVRERALAEHDLDEAEYRQVRALWRSWREKRQAPTASFERAFVARADAIDVAHLGAMEAYD